MPDDYPHSNGKPQLLLAGQGGGSWGCFPTGALLEYFEHNDTQAYDGGFGVSVSALIVSRLFGTADGKIPDRTAQKVNMQRLGGFFTSLKGNESVYTPWKAGAITATVTWMLSRFGTPDELKHLTIALIKGKPAVYDTTPLREMVGKELAGMQWDNSIRVGLVHLGNGTFEEVSLGNNPQWLDAVIASTAIPIAFPPIVGSVDGGVTDVTPLKGVFTRFREMRHNGHPPNQPQELHIYRCSPLPSHLDTGQKYGDVPAVGWRMLKIMLENADAEDNDNAKFYNQLASIMDKIWESGDPKLMAQFAKWHQKYGWVNIYIISPSEDDMKDMPSDARLFEPAKIKTGIERGRARMQDFLANKEKYRLENLV